MTMSIVVEINRNVVLSKTTGKQSKYPLPSRRYSLPSEPYSGRYPQNSRSAYSPPYNKGYPHHDRYPHYRQYSRQYPSYGSNVRPTTYFPPAQVAQPPRGYPQAPQPYPNQPAAPPLYPSQTAALRQRYFTQPPAAQPYPNPPAAPRPYPNPPSSGYEYKRPHDYRYRYAPVPQSRYPNPPYPPARNSGSLPGAIGGTSANPIPRANKQHTTHPRNMTASRISSASENLVKTLKSLILVSAKAKAKLKAGNKKLPSSAGLVQSLSALKNSRYPLEPSSSTTIYSTAGSPPRYQPQGAPTSRGLPRRGYPMTQSATAPRGPTSYPMYRSQAYPTYHSTTHSTKHQIKWRPQKTLYSQTTAAILTTAMLTSTTTTTTTPTTTTANSPQYPPDSQCSVQSECEVGCCYTAEGAILWDHLSISGTQGWCQVKISTKPGNGCHPLTCPCQGHQVCVSVPSESAKLPAPGSEPPEGGYIGNPKCYTKQQETKIKTWLNKLDAIVSLCRMDMSCPLAQPVPQK